MINRANIILTHNCNLRCKHCYISADKCKENQNEIFTTTKNLLNKLNEDGITSVMFTGGECMLFPYLKDLIIYAKQLNMQVSIFTNGMIFDSNIFDMVDSVNISLDGSEKVHNYIRQNDNSYSNIMKVLKYLKKIDKNTTLQFTISKLNIKDIEFLAELTFKYLNIRTVKMVFVSDEGRAKDNNIYHAQEDIEYVYSKLDDLYEKTKYHIQFVPNVLSKYAFENYYLSGDISLPIWFDIPKGNYYILSEEFMKEYSIKDYTIKTITKKMEEFITLLEENKEWIEKQKYINIESCVSEIITRGDYNGR